MDGKGRHDVAHCVHGGWHARHSNVQTEFVAIAKDSGAWVRRTNVRELRVLESSRSRRQGDAAIDNYGAQQQTALTDFNPVTWDQPNLTETGGVDGDGSFTYPGEHGPLASIRLVNIADGIEDWELLNKLGAQWEEWEVDIAYVYPKLLGEIKHQKLGPDYGDLAEERELGDGSAGHADIMLARSDDLLSWEKDPTPLYTAGGHPSGIDAQHARGKRGGRRHYPAHWRLSCRDAERHDHFSRHPGARGLHCHARSGRQADGPCYSGCCC